MERAITWSYGGGTQSIAIAVLIAQGRLPKPERIVIAEIGCAPSYCVECNCEDFRINAVNYKAVAESLAISQLRWILSASSEDVEQWRNGEDAARFVAELENCWKPK